LNVPLPDGIASRIGRDLPPRVQHAVGVASRAGRLLTSRELAASPDGVRGAVAVGLQARIAGANKILAATAPDSYTAGRMCPAL
jgi:hypothetical protein